MTIKNNILICGSDIDGATEERNAFLPKRHKKNGHPLITFRRSNKKIAHEFSLYSHDKEKEISVPWHKVTAALQELIGTDQPTISIDITSLELEYLIYLLPSLFELQPNKLTASYVSAKSYPQLQGHTNYDSLNYGDIQQPKGYASFPQHSYKLKEHKHIIFCGFEKSRAQKFIKIYDWSHKDILAIIADPPYVQNGVEAAYEANSPWLPELEGKFPANVIRCPGLAAQQLKNTLDRLFQDNTGLDIVPIGPKPFLLGALFFYMSLTEDDKARVRFLYDFPTPKEGRSKGIGKSCMYDCKDFA